MRLHYLIALIILLYSFTQPLIGIAELDPDSLPFVADEIEYDEENQIISAIGNVEIAWSKNILSADKLIYDQKYGNIFAIGNVRLIEPTGHIIYADYVELSQNLETGFVDHIKILLADNARITALYGERYDGKYMRFYKAQYSPCSICYDKDGNPSTLWKLRAQKIMHDSEKKDIYYRHAVLDIKGVPVFYTPYMSHPDPTVKRRSGLLAPKWGGSSELGPTLKNYIYVDIAPDKDFTGEITYTEKNNFLLGGEWRQRTNAGFFQVNTAFTKSDRFTGVGDERRKVTNRKRGYIFTKGQFDLNDFWRWGYDYKRTSDDSFLKIYDYSNETLLTSKLYTERFDRRNYSSIAAYDFQDIRPDAKNSPHILPWMYHQFYSPQDTFFKGRFEFENEVVALHRSPGADSYRLSAKLGWQRKDVLNYGFVSTLGGFVRGDLYYADHPKNSKQPENTKDITPRGFPQGEWTLSYPMARHFTYDESLYSHSFEPIAGIAVAPNVGVDPKIPNEDSLDLEYDVNNLFVSNRFSGIDRLEGGNRLNYGFKTGVDNLSGGQVNVFLGQSYRLRDDRTFTPETGLSKHFSDFVGIIQALPSEYVDLIYDFRLDQHDLKMRRQNLYGAVGPKIFRVHTDYLYINQQTLKGEADRRHNIIYGFSSNFYKNWTFSTSFNRKLGGDSKTLSGHLKLLYEDECFQFITQLSRDYTRRSGVDAGTTISAQIVFKTLGGIETPKITR